MYALPRWQALHPADQYCISRPSLWKSVTVLGKRRNPNLYKVSSLPHASRRKIAIAERGHCPLGYTQVRRSLGGS